MTRPLSLLLIVVLTMSATSFAAHGGNDETLFYQAPIKFSGMASTAGGASCSFQFIYDTGNFNITIIPWSCAIALGLGTLKGPPLNPVFCPTVPQNCNMGSSVTFYSFANITLTLTDSCGNTAMTTTTVGVPCDASTPNNRGTAICGLLGSHDQDTIKSCTRGGECNFMAKWNGTDYWDLCPPKKCGDDVPRSGQTGGGGVPVATDPVTVEAWDVTLRGPAGSEVVPMGFSPISEYTVIPRSVADRLGIVPFDTLDLSQTAVGRQGFGGRFGGSGGSWYDLTYLALGLRELNPTGQTVFPMATLGGADLGLGHGERSGLVLISDDANGNVGLLGGTFTYDVVQQYDRLSGHHILAHGAEEPMAYSRLPYVETFDATTAPLTDRPPRLWRQDYHDNAAGHDGNWLFHDAALPLGAGSPAADRSGQGFYAVVDDSLDTSTAVDLWSPRIDLLHARNPWLAFWVYSNNTRSSASDKQNLLSIDVGVVHGDGIITDIAPPIGHSGPVWRQVRMSLAEFSGDIIRVRFRGSNDNDGNYHSVAIDDVVVYDADVHGGQQPRLGVSVLDMNHAVNGSAEFVGTGATGPFFTTIPAGDDVRLHIAGAPAQPIVLLLGPLKVGLANFGLAGQLDIGQPVGGSGIGGLTVVASGLDGPGSGLFKTSATGSLDMVIEKVPDELVGSTFCFQAAVLDAAGAMPMLSNAIDVHVVVPIEEKAPSDGDD